MTGKLIAFAVLLTLCASAQSKKPTLGDIESDLQRSRSAQAAILAQSEKEQAIIKQQAQILAALLKQASSLKQSTDAKTDADSLTAYKLEARLVAIESAIAEQKASHEEVMKLLRQLFMYFMSALILGGVKWVFSWYSGYRRGRIEDAERARQFEVGKRDKDEVLGAVKEGVATSSTALTTANDLNQKMVDQAERFNKLQELVLHALEEKHHGGAKHPHA